MKRIAKYQALFAAGCAWLSCLAGCEGNGRPRDAACSLMETCTFQRSDAIDAEKSQQVGVIRHGDAYYLSTCASCDGLLGTRGETIDTTWQGRDLRFCGAACASAFLRDPDSGLVRIDRIMIADQLPWYPLKTSVVSGRPLGRYSIDFIWGNRLFRVMDVSERRTVVEEPARCMETLDRAVVEAQLTSYGMLEKCPVQGDILPSDSPIDIVVANRMVRVCCARCVRVVKARPSQYLAMVEYAGREKRERSTPPRNDEP